jgi:CRISPR system Cascade subunit CasA
MTRRRSWRVVALLLGAGCARYVPAPLDSAGAAPRYHARSLADPGLAAWLGTLGQQDHAEGRDVAWLAFAALYFGSELDARRAEWRAALAAEGTAARRPPIGPEADLERRVGGTGLEAPWVVALSLPLTIELGGKRGARVAAARARTLAARVALDDAVWRTVEAVRAAAADYGVSFLQRDVAARERTAAHRAEELVRARYAEGALPSTDLFRASADARAADAAYVAEQGRIRVAAGRLGRAVGVPPAEILGRPLHDPSPRGCIWADSLGADSLEAIALRRRSEIGIALARYAGAEADVRLAVAGRNPDLTLAPGFIWDQGVHRWTLGLGLPGLIRRGRGPAPEAMARRAAVAAEVAAAQTAVLGDLDVAREECGAARTALTALDSVVDRAGEATRAARDAYGRGETGELELRQAEIVEARAERERVSAAQRLTQASLDIETAVGFWPAGPTRWPDPRESPRSETGS